MPEEINRIVTDILSDYLFCTTQKAVDNLLKEGCSKDKIHLVGNVAIDTLLYNIKKLPERKVDKPYILCTIHRQSNTDIRNNLEIILKAIERISKDFKVLFPIHPRTLNKIKEFKFDKHLKYSEVLEPMNYMDFLYNVKNASLVITDSGGVQVETTVLDIPCLTVRENTEWKFTLIEGTNKLIGVKNTEQIIDEVYSVLNKPPKSNLNKVNKKLLDGKASERIVKILIEEYKL